MISVDLSHPALMGCRAFMYPISPNSGLGWVNLTSLWSFTTHNGLDANSEFGQMPGAHPAIKTGANSPGGSAAAYYSFWRDIWPDSANKDMTVIARVISRSSNQSTFICGARDPSNGGFLFGLWDSGGADNGYAVFLYGGGSSWIFTDQGGQGSATQDVPLVVAFTYEQTDQRLSIYRDGALIRSGTNTGATWNPYTPSATEQFTIGRANSGFVFSGDIGWVVVFNRVLSAAEIQLWTRDNEWPWVWEDPLFFLEPAEGTYTTAVAVNSALSVTVGSEPVMFTTTVDAEAIVDGDFSIEPDPPAVGTFTTQIAVGSTVYLDTPEFGVFVTGVGVASTITSTAPVTFVTRVGVRSDARGLVDGRTDLIDTEHYRR